MKKLSTFILTSLVIGNVIAWMMGAAPIDFAIQPYSELEEQNLTALQNELKDNPEDTDLMVELGSIYSLHNDIEKAAVLLDKAKMLSPKDSLTLAWHSANSAKLAGSMVDLSFGMYKMYQLRKACDGLVDAVGQSPDDLSIRMLRLATFANIGKVNHHFDTVFDDEKWFNQLFEQSQDSMPKPVKSQFYLLMAQAYLNQADEYSAEKLEHYLALYKDIPSNALQDKVQFQTIETQFAAAERGNTWK